MFSYSFTGHSLAAQDTTIFGSCTRYRLLVVLKTPTIAPVWLKAIFVRTIGSSSKNQRWTQPGWKLVCLFELQRNATAPPEVYSFWSALTALTVYHFLGLGHTFLLVDVLSVWAFPHLSRLSASCSSACPDSRASADVPLGVESNLPTTQDSPSASGQHDTNCCLTPNCLAGPDGKPASEHLPLKNRHAVLLPLTGRRAGETVLLPAFSAAKRSSSKSLHGKNAQPQNAAGKASRKAGTTSELEVYANPHPESRKERSAPSTISFLLRPTCPGRHDCCTKRRVPLRIKVVNWDQALGWRSSYSGARHIKAPPPTTSGDSSSPTHRIPKSTNQRSAF
ncbi:hypothetical protein O181_036657 [Austropuccinia psidii MF-1]|uniref:Uncharacterized protein n=1 Tax=Austropuccinia psidii MF-1 TaxID=1389203 RepID=A0A9Q3D7H6_9BASI|nr:hypothetical protein [Austropuccinia psidii MF-1]